MYGRTDKSVAIGALVSACAVLAVAAWLKPAAAGYGTHMQLGLPPCNFLRLTHLPCPSCGLTTCFAWAVRLQFRNAFFANPFGILAFFVTVLTIPAAMVLLWRRISFRRITEHDLFPKSLYAATALYFISWIFKLSTFHFVGY
jgi:CBS-domain-containing membrane protein